MEALCQHQITHTECSNSVAGKDTCTAREGTALPSTPHRAGRAGQCHPLCLAQSHTQMSPSNSSSYWDNYTGKSSFWEQEGSSWLLFIALLTRSASTLNFCPQKRSQPAWRQETMTLGIIFSGNGDEIGPLNDKKTLCSFAGIPRAEGFCHKMDSSVSKDKGWWIQ